jgi:hypothetical protein
MCAMAQTPQSTNKAPNFVEHRYGEVRRIRLLRRWVNKVTKRKGRPELLLCGSVYTLWTFSACSPFLPLVGS